MSCSQTMVPQILVTGGAGYIGSHMVKMLLDAAYGVVVLDDLSSGYVDSIVGGHFVKGSIADTALVRNVMEKHQIAAVMHFASCIQVGESVLDPSKYYRNNFSNTVLLLDAMRACDVKRFIFSSSAAVYGEPVSVPISERHPIRPLNPYGRSKWMVEQLLEDYGRAYDFSFVTLRYFNAAGAHPSGFLGERHEPETHLIPLVLRVASGRESSIKVFGSDYDTPDGTCIRDFVHVVDLCEAHLLALKGLLNGAASTAVNLGNGSGFSVHEVIQAAERVTGRSIRTVMSPRRAGDPARLVADSAKAREFLGWRPQFDKLDTIIEHAWVWEQRQLVGERLIV